MDLYFLLSMFELLYSITFIFIIFLALNFRYIPGWETESYLYIKLDPEVRSCNIYNKMKRISAFIIDETLIQIGNQLLIMDLYWIRLWNYTRNKYFQWKKHVFSREFYQISIFISGKHTVYTDGGIWDPQLGSVKLRLFHRLC